MTLWLLSRFVPQGLSNLEVIAFSFCVLPVDWECHCTGLQRSLGREL